MMNSSLNEAIAGVAQQSDTLAVYDLRTIGPAGIEIIDAVRRKSPCAPVIMLTDQATMAAFQETVEERRSGLGWVDNTQSIRHRRQKPTLEGGVVELLSRVRTKLRLAKFQRFSFWWANLSRNVATAAYETADSRDSTEVAQRIAVGNLAIDLLTYEVYLESQPVHLTPTEFKVLATLASHLGEVLDYVTLVQRCLGYQSDIFEAKELIKRHIYTLRRKIEPAAGSPRYIINVRSVGYRMAVPKK